MRHLTVIGDRIILYSYIDRETESYVHVCAKLPNNDWECARLNVIDWKIENDGAGPVLMTYQMRNDTYAPIFDTRFEVVKESSKLARPNKSKNWKLDQYGDYWFNFKTGKRVYV